MNADIDSWPFVNAWGVGQYLKLPVENVLLAWEDGLLPEPRSLRPLRWHADDLIYLFCDTLATQPYKEVTNA